MGIFVLAIVLLLTLGFILFYFLYISQISSSAKVKIIIYADNPDETEKAIINTYYHAAQHLRRAEIYIHGADDAYISSLLRAYTFLKKDDTFEKP